MINDHRQWLYKGSRGRIFEMGEEIPKGWFDAPNAKEWDNPPVEIAIPQLNSDDAPAIDEHEEPPPKKYPSQMNVAELKEHGKLFDLEFSDGMTKREMRDAINDAVERAE